INPNPSQSSLITIFRAYRMVISAHSVFLHGIKLLHKFIEEPIIHLFGNTTIEFSIVGLVCAIKMPHKRHIRVT
ncbi:MAG: hypothetical protein MJ240_08405, partial [Kiritimatiellae bacterium]|nr:hypothetical protein [Kiritimatiellia bacterium]